MQVISAAGGGWIAAQASAGFSARFFALNLWTLERAYSPTREGAKRLAVKLAKKDGPQRVPNMRRMLELADHIKDWTY
jgi:hypothetical protein